MDEGTADRPRRRRRSLVVLAGLVVGASAAAAFLGSPLGGRVVIAVGDQATVWLDPPSPEARELAGSTGMTGDAERIFFASRPELEGPSEFNEHCSSEGSIVLGCFSAGRIYIYRVTDERLSGTNEVTAAHEMLHAAYARLGEAERERVDAMIARFVAGLPEGDPLRQSVAGYPASQFATEYHSRLGTEAETLSPELEEYFGRYFDDRGAVYQTFRASQAALEDTRARIDALTAELDALRARIVRDDAAYRTRSAALSRDIDDFNARAATPGSFPSQEDFDRERAALQSRADAVEADRLALNAAIARYNALRDELTALDASYAELYSHLDSRAPSGEQPQGS